MPFSTSSRTFSTASRSTLGFMCAMMVCKASMMGMPARIITANSRLKATSSSSRARLNRAMPRRAVG
jgi:hypothetical protein